LENRTFAGIFRMMTDPRPLSPHLQVYRWQLTSVLSILHRASGIALSIGTILLVWWLLAAAEGPEAYAQVQGFLGSWVGLLLLFGWSVALYYHLCNGLRHLWWDTGRGLDLKSVYAGGWTVLAATALLTVLTWAVGLSHWSR
jgi:succinate dehydrogenase / fumarate reductase cytochrome b subunit